MFRSFRLRVLMALAAVAAVLAFTVVEADARRGGGFGSRGAKTYSAPPPTATAPGQAGPINRSMTQPGQTSPSAVQRPGMGQQPGGFFNRPGLLGGLAMGFLGAGLIGLLMGNGLFGGLAGLASFFGLLLQIALIGGVAYLIWTWWQRRSQPVPATVRARTPRDMPGHMRDMPAQEPQRPMGLGALGGGLGLGASGSAPQPVQAGHDEVGLTPADFDAFERILGEIQSAYAAENIDRLGDLVTPEVLSYFAQELHDHKTRGVVNRVDDVKLLQGDLAEAWREGSTEYATVAMRYAMRDRMVDRASGRVVEGNDEPVEVTEVWTFMRPRGGDWTLSAIQDA